MSEEDSSPKTKPPVTVFGAGIGGLTVAHELAERGFDVEVIDPDFDKDGTWDRGIGGMARSQFAYGLPPGKAPPPMKDRMTIRRLRPANFLYQPIVFKPETSQPVDEKGAELLISQVAELIQLIRSENREPNMLTIVATTDTRSLSDARLQYLLDKLNAWLTGNKKPAEANKPERDKPPEGVEKVEEINKPELVDISYLTKLVAYIQPSGPRANRLEFSVLDAQLFPAEHGFRFFPSFYRHLFDTMKRTPILNPTPRESPSATVFDNLVSSDVLGFARAGTAKSFAISRRPAKGLEDLRRNIGRVLGELEYTTADIDRFGLKIFKYLTSCSERRAKEYESLSWGDFVEQRLYSPVSARHIEFGPQMSAALRGSESDARTQGNITVQLMVDQLHPDAHTDSLLNAPTSGAWFNHWYDYLVQQNVTFRRDRLKSLELKDAALVPELESGTGAKGEYFVLALPLQEAERIARTLLSSPRDQLEAALRSGRGSVVRSGRENDFQRVVRFANSRLQRIDGLAKDLEDACPKGPLQHLSGIQFYFDVDVRFWRGHTQYLDSAWGLTSIAQPQFWGRRRNPRDAYRSILSVDIGIWDKNDERTPKKAWDCSPDEIAELAWAQIKDHHDNAFADKYGPDAKIPEPIAYALDQRIEFRPSKPKLDLTPFLVNRVGDYRKRPGGLIDNSKKLPGEPVQSKCKSLYDVDLKCVFVGTYMRTYTRLTSMEGANESARHAVNALLSKMEVTSDRCEIWDPEDEELADLQWWKDLDQGLLREGRPHMIDILGCTTFAEIERSRGLFGGRL